MTHAAALLASYKAAAAGTRTFLGRTSPPLGSSSPNQTDRAWLTKYTVPAGGMNIDGVRYLSGSGAPSGAMFKGIVFGDTAGAPGSRIFLGAATACPAANTVSPISSGSNIFVPGGTVIYIGPTWQDSIGNSTCDSGGGDGSTIRTYLLNGTYSYASPPATAGSVAATYPSLMSVEATGVN